MKAQLHNYRQSPRKVRLVADLIKGKTVTVALEQLSFLPKRAADPLGKLLRSAVANTANRGTVLAGDQLTVRDVRVDAGTTLKRQMPRARGSASRINKRTSKIIIELSPLKAI